MTDHDDRLVPARFAAEVCPDLPTAVGLAGVAHRAEVGGNVCFHTVIGIAIVIGE